MRLHFSRIISAVICTLKQIFETFLCLLWSPLWRAAGRHRWMTCSGSSPAPGAGSFVPMHRTGIWHKPTAFHSVWTGETECKIVDIFLVHTQLIKSGCTFGSSTTFIFFVCFPHCQTCLTCSLAININLDLDLSTEMSGLVSQHHQTTSFLTLMHWLTHFYSFLNAFYPVFTQTLNNGSYFMFQSNIANAQQQQRLFSPS